MNINIISNDMSGNLIAKTRETIKTIIETPAASVPMYRGLGVDRSFLSSSSVVAREMLAQEIIEKVERDEPRVVVEEISFEVSEIEGKLTATIKIGRNEDYEEETAETAASTNESEEDEFYYDEEDYDADEFLSDGEEVEED